MKPTIRQPDDKRLLDLGCPRALVAQALAIYRRPRSGGVRFRNTIGQVIEVRPTARGHRAWWIKPRR
jgi:hypothetical protein